MQEVAGGNGRATTFDELGIFQILAEVEEPASVERFVRSWLSALLDYDARRGSELVTTLSTYLECGRNYNATSAALGVHRSTLKYRLQRVRELSGHDLADPDAAFNLHLAARAWRTLQALRDEGS